MGFNNGYDSGYSDCEAENRKRWEREAVERYKAENPPSGGGSSGGGSSGGGSSGENSPGISLDFSDLAQAVMSSGNATYDTTVVRAVELRPNDGDCPYFAIDSSNLDKIFIIPSAEAALIVEYGGVFTPRDSGFIATGISGPGMYTYIDSLAPSVAGGTFKKIADLDSLQGVPLAS